MLVPLLGVAAQAETWRLASPNGRVQVEVVRSDAKGLPRYSVKYDGYIVIAPSSMGLHTNLPLSEFAAPEVTRRSVDEVYHMVLGNARSVPDRYHEMTLSFSAINEGHNIDLIFRAYDDGAAFRYVVPPQANEYTVYGEQTEFAFPVDYTLWGSDLGRSTTSHEREFLPTTASQVRVFHRYDHPLVGKTGHKETTFALAESDVENYPGAYYSRGWNNALGVVVQLAPLIDSHNSNPQAAKIAQDTPLRTPWRVIMLGDSPRALVESSLVATLGAPSRVADTSWIRSGKAAWEWWHNENVERKTETYLAYIDFAYELGLEYLLIDNGWYEGWSIRYKEGSDITKPIPAMDIPKITAYAKERNIGVILWAQWKQLDDHLDEAFAAFERWGVAGVEPDFMDRNDQEMVNWYHKVLSKAAEHRLVVTMHGAYPPNGLVRTYPNYINQEGVLAAEYNKFSKRITARHNVTLPYTRMILGPMDYTPGGFTHVKPEDYYVGRFSPVVQTTRGHGVAMYVVFDSPLTRLSDSREAYRKPDGSWADGIDFIREVPTTWDETRVLQGDIGEYIVTVRRKDDTWYLGAMTNEDGRTLDIPLDFLGKGTYEAKIWQDAEGDISSLDVSTQRLKRNARLKMKLAPTGGGVAVFKPASRR
ncbi:alpha-glucosidase [Cephaloticoccus primus]|uniref:Alpha-glucosidase n=1 Tax=Cephaloticoccus primus TaxID=1548207 RepID=A0A139SK34_9BACT|nr:alpha-glucosidase [Cephaloticoccus primus]